MLLGLPPVCLPSWLPPTRWAWRQTYLGWRSSPKRAKIVVADASITHEGLVL